MAEITKLLAIIGTAKAGTSALAYHLDMHEMACLGWQKEPRFFTAMDQQVWGGPGGEGFQKSMIPDFDAYRENFKGLRQDQWAIDASTDYLWREETPDLLEKFAANCDVRLVCLVRDPVARAISEYNHTIRAKWETGSFCDSLEAEGERYKNCWHPLFYHRRRSIISEDVQRYADRFGDRLMILDYADLHDANAVTQRLCTFLDIPAMPVTEMERRNESFIPRNAIVQTMLKNRAVRSMGRSLLSKGLRQSIRQKLVPNARDIATVQPEERAQFWDLIADEIDACARNPLIPTENWTCL